MNKRLPVLLLCLVMLACLIPPAGSAAALLPAFPGAEGAAMYITGGRGGDVYTVTSLEDYRSGEEPIPGTLRYGLTKVANNRSKATVIVFDVSGTIHLKEKIKTNVYNLTIAGQTAPGDGIAIGGYSVSLGGENVIIRHIRFRGGFAELDDTFSPNGPRMLIDHCSFSWSTDEVLSTKDRSSITVQWSIISNSLNMSIHDKGSHGYGGIWGGTNMSFHHNLIANNNSRNPRLDRDFRLEKDAPLLFDLRNNVIYNWGGNSGYGGENATGVNVVNNYYKAGPATFDDVKSRVFNPWSEQPGSYYIEGNAVEGYPQISADNWAGGVQPEYGLGTMNRLEEPVAITFKQADGTIVPTPVATDSAEEAYEKVLRQAGAVLPKRDSLDARIVSDVRLGLGKFANTPEGDGGFPALKEEARPAGYDSDGDGMPDAWELAQGLNPNDPEDGKADSGSGYTHLENYLNAIAGSGSANPDVAIASPTPNEMIRSGEDIVIEASASDSDGTVTKVEFSYYDTTTMKLHALGEATSAPYTYTWRGAPEGTHYLYAKATDDTGTQTLSSLVVVHVNGTGGIEPWSSLDIGEVSLPGTASAANGGADYTIKGSGKIGASGDGLHSADSFHYMYREVPGDAELIGSVGFQSPSEYDDGAKAGLMIRQSLDDDAPFAMMTVMKEKYYGTRIHLLVRSAQGGLVVSEAQRELELPALMKIAKYGDEIKGYVSKDGGAEWEEIGSVPFETAAPVYMGMAVDAAKSTNNFDYYNASLFKNTELRVDGTGGGDPFTAVARVTDAAGEAVHTLEPGQSIFASASFHNNSQIDKNAVLVLALVDADNRMASYTYSVERMEGQGTKELEASFRLPADLAGYRVQAFVWDSLDGKQLISNISTLP